MSPDAAVKWLEEEEEEDKYNQIGYRQLTVGFFNKSQEDRSRKKPNR